jgi:hypothetical protein
MFEIAAPLLLPALAVGAIGFAMLNPVNLLTAGSLW